MQPSLSPAGQEIIARAVEHVFDRIKARYLGPQSLDKRLIVSYNPDLSLPGLFFSASREEQAAPDRGTLSTLMRVAAGYLDAERERAKVATLATVSQFLRNAAAQGVKTDLETVLGGQIAEIWARAATGVKRIIETESTVARNVGVIDGIVRVAAAGGVRDPVVFWIGPLDEHTCNECKRMFLMPDSTTPKLWLFSEIGHGYHRRGDQDPKVGGCHPNCRHTLTYLSPGYGFDSEGKIHYVGHNFDGLRHQRGERREDG